MTDKIKLQTVNFPRLNAKTDADERARLVATMARNIGKVLDAATDAEIADGCAWYGKARGFAFTLAKRFNVSLQTVAHVIAALSPNCGWARNQLDALTVLLANADGKQSDAVKVSTYNANKVKAFQILATGKTEILGGLKTRAFADNIGNTASDAVTIDFHAASVARGIRFTTQTAKPITAPQYNLISEAYRHAAQRAGLRAHEVQAITWCVWRRLHNVHAMHG